MTSNVTVYLPHNIILKLNLDSEWQAILADEIEKPYFHDLMEKVDEEYKLHACYPPRSCFPLLITAVVIR
jgi:uracil DNA glycosylase